VTNKSLLINIGKWGGRATALLLVLFWGAFFIEHLQEWFLRGGGQYPPPRVWVGQILHLAVLAGLASMLRWERLGALITVAATASFFAWIGYRGTLVLPLINLVPIAFFSLYWLARKS
jgi:hypothetical protein